MHDLHWRTNGNAIQCTSLHTTHFNKIVLYITINVIFTYYTINAIIGLHYPSCIVCLSCFNYSFVICSDSLHCTTDLLFLSFDCEPLSFVERVWGVGMSLYTIVRNITKLEITYSILTDVSNYSVIVMQGIIPQTGGHV